ncbi:hypothetical protein C8F04DRAFT_1188446 [Mycena alexandri]|uniref:Uncharacterized protein n=1 Tax=Mycena alexandri TaxID=1745969 RepID=A0AAD6SKX9_9AGAR|nr:hypothetical protein C8F04DRAFT_1188446 [Mycena alexandri]
MDAEIDLESALLLDVLVDEPVVGKRLPNLEPEPNREPKGLKISGFRTYAKHFLLDSDLYIFNSIPLHPKAGIRVDLTWISQPSRPISDRQIFQPWDFSDFRAIQALKTAPGATDEVITRPDPGPKCPSQYSEWCGAARGESENPFTEECVPCKWRREGDDASSDVPRTVLDAELERGVRFSHWLNPEPEPAFRFGSAFEWVRT